MTLLDGADLVARATAARAAGADLVVVSMHAGVEYSTPPTDDQVELATFLAASGQVDLVLGHHAHVPSRSHCFPVDPAGGHVGGLRSGELRVQPGLRLLRPEHRLGTSRDRDRDAARGGPARVTGFEWTGTTVDRLGKHAVHALSEVLTTGTATLGLVTWRSATNASGLPWGRRRPNGSRPRRHRRAARPRPGDHRGDRRCDGLRHARGCEPHRQGMTGPGRAPAP
ncbi:CapA family protein [Oerskovia sp. M15]